MNMMVSACMSVSIHADFGELSSQDTPEKAVVPACACISMASSSGSVWDEVPPPLVAPPLGQATGPDVEKATAKSQRTGPYTGQASSTPEPPWPAKAGERVPPARPPPKARRMTMEELVHAVTTLPHKQPAVKRVPSPPAKTPPGRRSRADIAAYGPLPAQSSEGSGTPAAPKPVEFRVPPSERLERRTTAAPYQPHGVYMASSIAKA